jgi:hypothetical protein
MFLPRGITKYEPMQTEFVSLEKFLDSMRQDVFTGFCEFRAGEKSVVWLFETGKIQRTFCVEGGKTRLLMPDQALKDCQTASGEVRGVILPPEIVDILIRLLFCEPIYQNLSTAFTDLKDLLRNLESEKVTGFIEIKVEEDVHYILLEMGAPWDALYFSGNWFARGAEALENIFGDTDNQPALISIYETQKVPLAEVFVNLSNGLFKRYSELKGPMLARKFWKKLSFCAENFSEVGIGDLEFRLEDLPRDMRKQEEILVSLLQCQIESYENEWGEEATRTLYLNLLENTESPMKELFGIVVQEL